MTKTENTAFLTNIKKIFQEKIARDILLFNAKNKISKGKENFFMKKKKARKDKQDKKGVVNQNDQKDAFNPDDYYEY